MNGARTLRAGLLATFLAAAPAHGQLVSAPLERSWMTAWPDGPPASGLSPALWLDRDGIGYGVGGALLLGLPAPAGAATEPGRGPGSVLELAARGLDPQASSQPWSAAMSARLHGPRAGHGIWLGAAGVAPSNGSDRLPLAGAGLWLQRGRITFEAQVVQLLRPLRIPRPAVPVELPIDTSVFVIDELPPGDDLRFLTGLETAVRWTRGRTELRARAGAALGLHQAPARWGEVRAAYWARPNIALFATAASTARVPVALESVQGERAAIGIQLVTGQAAGAGPAVTRLPDEGFELERLDGAMHRLILRASGRYVEVASDATGWSVLPARRVGPGTWEVVLTLEPGIHRVAMRVNGGAWRAPPGMPTASDDFGGEVGLLVVP